MSFCIPRDYSFSSAAVEVCWIGYRHPQNIGSLTDTGQPVLRPATTVEVFNVAVGGGGDHTKHEPNIPANHLRPAPFFAGFAARSRSSRSAVRFLAAASDAFSARADRCSGVMFFAAFLPPRRPKVRAISVIAARTSGGIFMPIPQIVYLTGYGANSWKLSESVFTS